MLMEDGDALARKASMLGHKPKTKIFSLFQRKSFEEQLNNDDQVCGNELELIFFYSLLVTWMWTKTQKNKII